MTKFYIILGYFALSIINSVFPLIISVLLSLPFWGILLISSSVLLATFSTLCLMRCAAMSKFLVVRQ